MILAIKENLIAIAEFAHRKIFKEEMGEEMGKFLNHLSWSFFGGLIAAGIVFVLNILAGRWLGPVEYGKYSLTVAMSSIFIIPMMLGTDTALTYYTAGGKSKDEKKENIASSLWLVPVFTFFSVLILIFLSPWLAAAFNAQKELVIVAIFFSAFAAARATLDSVIKGLHFFKIQSFLKIAESLVVAAVFLAMIKIYHFFSFQSFVWGLLSGCAFFALAALWVIRNYLSLSKKRTRKILSYGLFAVLGSVSGILLYSADKIFINKYLGSDQLGLYQAYTTASILIVSQIMTLFVNVFFPHLASLQDSGAVFKKLNKLAGIFFFPSFLFLCLMICLAIMLFGEKYRLDWLLVAEFGFLGTMIMYVTALWWLIASKGKEGVKFISFNGIAAGLFFIFLVFIFSGKLSLYLVVFFLILAVLFMIIRGNLNYTKIR